MVMIGSVCDTLRQITPGVVVRSTLPVQARWETPGSSTKEKAGPPFGDPALSSANCHLPPPPLFGRDSMTAVCSGNQRPERVERHAKGRHGRLTVLDPAANLVVFVLVLCLLEQ